MNKIKLIISREYNERVRKRMFILTTLLTPLLLLVLILAPAMIASMDTPERREIVVADHSGVISSRIKSTETIDIITTNLSYEEASKQYLNSYGFLIIENDSIENINAVKLYTKEASTHGLERELKNMVQNAIREEKIARHEMSNLDSLLSTLDSRVTLSTFSINEGGSKKAEQTNSSLSMAISSICGIMIYFFIFLYGTMIMNGVIEEKQNRIIEILVGSVKPFQLMMGKIIGIGLVALTQVAIWGVIVGLGINFIGDADAIIASSGISEILLNPLYLLKIVGLFVVYFVGGYLLYASMFAAVGSAVDNVQDIQQLQMPVTVPLILSIVLMSSVSMNPTSSMSFWLSVIPFTSPIIMMARIPSGVPIWEVILSIVTLYISFILMAKFAAKIYRIGIFMYGKKPSLKEFIRWYKLKY